MLRRFATISLCLLGGLLLCAAKQKSKPFDFTSGQPLAFGMQQRDAEEVTSSNADWKITFRIDTPSTAEIACLYQEESYFRLGFYQGECYSIEKRIQVPRAEVERIFNYYAPALGETGEATQSEDNSLFFSRWSKGAREISLTADQGTGDIYKLTYEESDILKSGDARHAQQEELSSQPQSVDPITGKPRLLPQGAGDNGSGDDATDQGGAEDEGSKEPPVQDKGAKDKGAKGKGSKSKGGEGDAAEEGDDAEKGKDSGIGRDDPNEW